MSYLIRSQILQLPVNMLIDDDEYSHHNREKLQLPIQKQLSKKPKTFCCNFIAFLEFTLNFEAHSLSISEITESKNCCYLSV